MFIQNYFLTSMKTQCIIFVILHSIRYLIRIEKYMAQACFKIFTLWLTFFVMLTIYFTKQ